MNTKKLIWIGAVIGSTLGGMVPQLWHAGWLSLSSILLSTVGAFVGIWAAWRLGR